MIHTSALLDTLAPQFRWIRVQSRTKKYLPFYLETRKRAGRKNIKDRQPPTVTTGEAATSDSSPKNDFVSRLASPEEAMEVIRSIRCSLGDIETSSEQHIFRLWTRLDVTRVALRGMAMLPHPVGPKPRVVAICEDDEARLALECGASYAGLDSILERIAGGWTNFDTCVTTTVHMPKLVKVARILGPKKLMPNMKEGTLASNLLEAVRRMSSANSVQFRALPIDEPEFEMLQAAAFSGKKPDFDADHIGVVEVPIATGDATPQNVITNAKQFIREVMRQKPTTATKTDNSQFQWPPPRKSANAILDAFSALGNEGKVDNEFILASALGIAHKGKSVMTPIMVDTTQLM
ncbi:50S ribosomal protein L1 [Babesia sp. Xinjiang]|uniref:50S ribosomal protein L1 n=1 Tax=Babesia sp. Xinjiang TaxID=462227 RepID=UPI000A22FB58|nr:50S ribosomal protein L1 [Babesia sp. Xinjiang]ORM39439.1 50S ribosomal protein L1 [Babesia sp. Xinjiang]